MGQPKQLLVLNDKPAVQLCVEAVASSGIDRIVTVIAKDDTTTAHVLAKLPVTVACNNIPGSDMAESLRAGLDKIDGASTGVLICLADHPLVLPATIAILLKQHEQQPERIIIPSWNGRRGHPTLVPASLVREVGAGRILRDVIADHPDKTVIVPVTDQGVILDMDTPEDYARLKDQTTV